MANYKTIWKPRVLPSTDWGTLDRPSNDLSMFYEYDNITYSHEYTDFYTGNKVNFGRTLSGSDNRIENLQDCWRYNSGYGMTWGYCKKTNYISWHLGAIPSFFSKAEIKGFKQHLLPGYIGVRFQYRWPDTDTRNFWRNSPVHINDMMLHYYNVFTDQIESYEAKLTETSTSNKDLWPDRYVSNDSRRSDTWKGCYWQPEEVGAVSRIRNFQLCMVGMSVEMKYSDRGGASHSRCMDIRNLTPIYDLPNNHKYRPLLAKPRENNWSETGNMELYLV